MVPENVCKKLHKVFDSRAHLASISYMSEATREELETKYGKGNVWNTGEMVAAFEVHGFLAPFCTVTRKADGVKGTLEFFHNPRLYFRFIPQN